MAVYGMNSPRREDRRLYGGVHRASAADLPPKIACGNTCEAPAEAEKPKEKKLFEGLIDEFFEGGIDSDKLLIAALLYILIKEGADIKLVIALGYILM